MATFEQLIEVALDQFGARCSATNQHEKRDRRWSKMNDFLFGTSLIRSARAFPTDAAGCRPVESCSPWRHPLVPFG